MRSSNAPLLSRPSVRWTAVAVVVLAGVALALSSTLGGSGEEGKVPVHVVERGPLVISVSESGTIKNREQVVLKCEVEGRTTVLFLAPEGNHVQPGDLVAELDSSRLEEQKASQEITVSNAKSGFIRARENLEVAKSQAESDIAQAELDLRFAKLDLTKYEEGDYPQQIQEAEGKITIAHEVVERAKEKLKWSKQLHESRYLSLSELQADELALKTAELDYELAVRRKKVLEEYTATRDRAALSSAIVQAERALERTRRKASADIVQAEADLRAKELEHRRQEAQFVKLEDQIKKCKITAPVAGMVVYATTGGDRRGNQEPLDEGQEVRERQELIYLPTATSMMAEVKVHESNLKKVRPGLPVRLSVDAAPGRTFNGTLAKIAVLPDSQSWWGNPDLKLYNSEVHIEGDGSDLRPGMSCRAEIFVERYDDALFVPIQSVVRIGGSPTVFVRTSGGSEPRVVKIGLDNNRMVHILDGLAEGEEVLLAPPLGATKEEAADTPEIPAAAPESTPAANGKPEQTETKPAADAEGAADAGNGDTTDWRSLSPEERRKRFEALSPEERQKLMEQFRQRGGRGRDQNRGDSSGQ